MIDIGDIDFKFRMKDEAFARDLYGRWDDFYRDALHEIIEGVLARQDKEGELIRLECLELNLGNIRQKDFYQQFPVRLKEELERAFSYQSMQAGSRESAEERVQRRLASLRFYLEKGFCPTIWEDAEFNLEKEMQFLLLHTPQGLAHLFHEAIRYPGRLRRMVWGMPGELLGSVMLLWLEEKHIPQDEKEMRLMELEKKDYVLSSSLQKIVKDDQPLSERLSGLWEGEKTENYMSWLLSTAISVYEKRRSLARLLDTKPVVVLRFIHDTPDEKSIRSLAGLLDKVMVRQIINTESENHTEVDVPAYWMYLYNWLIKNYPFNGVYMFGNKMQFKEYLNVKLLHFIRKRSGSAYLSKAELTVQFLIEVFGREYYLEVLNIIYNQQERNADGSPVYSGYFNMELYYMFLRLSLIKIPARTENRLDNPALMDIGLLMVWLKDNKVSPVEKQTFLNLLAKEQWAVLLPWIREQKEYPVHLAVLARFMDEVVVYRILASVSCYAAELFVRLAEVLQSEAGKIKGLSGMDSARLSLFIRTAMLRWIVSQEGKDTNSREMVEVFLRILYKVISGEANDNVIVFESDQEVEEVIGQISEPLHLSGEKEWEMIGRALKEEDVSQKHLDLLGKGLDLLGGNTADVLEYSSKWIGHLRALLESGSISMIEKRRKIAWLMEVFRNRYESFVILLKEHALLARYIAVMDPVLLERLVIGLIRQGHQQPGVCLFPFYSWILAHDTCLDTFLKGGTVKLKEKMILLFADWAVDHSIGNLTARQVGKLFMEVIFGRENIFRISQGIYQALIRDFSLSGKPGQMYESEYVMNLLFQVTGFSLFSFMESDNYADGSGDSEAVTGNQIQKSEEGRVKLPSSDLLEKNNSACKDKDINLLLQQDFVRWSQSIEKEEYTFHLIVEKYLDKPADFMAWIKMDSICAELKRKMLRHYSVRHPNECMCLLRGCPNDEAYLSRLAEIWGIAGLLEFIGHISIFKAEILSQVIGTLQRHPDFLSVIKEHRGRQGDRLSRALLLFILDVKALGHNALKPEEIIRKWVECLHVSYTGKTVYRPSEESQWRQVEILLAGKLGVQMDGMVLEHKAAHPESRQDKDEIWRSSSVRREEIADLLKRPVEKMVLQRHVAIIMEYHSKLLLDFLEKDADKIMAEKLAAVIDRVLLERLMVLVSASIDRAQTVFFSRLMTWLRQHLIGDSSEEILFCALLSWMRERTWRNETQEQMRDFFFTRLHEKLENIPEEALMAELYPQGDKILASESVASSQPTTPLPEEEAVAETIDIPIQEWDEPALMNWLKDSAVSRYMKQYVLHQILVSRPERILSLVRKMMHGEMVLPDEWSNWLDEKDWIRIVAGRSLYKAELLEQIMEYLLKKQLVGEVFLRTALVRFLIERDFESWIRESGNDTVRQFIQLIERLGGKNEPGSASPEWSAPELAQQVEKELSLGNTEQELAEKAAVGAPEYISVGNAGVVLLTPWFPRLFGMLGLLDEEKKDFRDMESRIRAIFIIQRLVTYEEREYEEKELSFNRILVSCPFSEPLPVKMELTENELQTIEYMLDGVKNNWTKVQNISIKGFQTNFIERSGNLEQREDKWSLFVDPRAYDMLLDTLPWSYDRVRFPWLKKQIHVSWRTKEDF